MRPQRIGFLVVGNEILQGFITDTNSTFLSRNLTSLGHKVLRIVTVEDDVSIISKNLRLMIKDDLDVIFVCGGLGSTPDDVTMAAVGQALNLGLHVDPKARGWVQERVKRLHAEGRILTDKMDEPHIRMATVPRGALVLHNKVGTAPGTVLKIRPRTKGRKTKTIIVLPGVPKELMYLYSTEIEGKIIKPTTDRKFYKDLRVRIAESTMHEVLKDFCEMFPTVYLGSYPQEDRSVILRLSGRKKQVLASMEHLMAGLSRLSKSRKK